MQLLPVCILITSHPIVAGKYYSRPLCSERHTSLVRVFRFLGDTRDQRTKDQLMLLQWVRPRRPPHGIPYRKTPSNLPLLQSAFFFFSWFWVE